jgi:thiol:disulfide interchange protein DsbD
MFRYRLGFCRSLVAALAFIALFANPALSQGPQPAKKDSNPRTKPKDVVVTASVSPTEARPGDAVTYKVTAKLAPGSHIYKYANVQEGDGPRNTRFDFFDTAGLVIAGDWTASKPAIRKKEPVFPDIEFVEYYEGEVTWSIPLKVPADASRGKRVLRCQASYQICDASKCSFPGQWTLPDVELTILPPSTPAGAVESKSADSPVAVSDGKAPKIPDTKAFLKPRGAKLGASVSLTEAKPGETVKYQVSVELEPGYHIYAYSKVRKDGGPPTTQIDFFDTGGLEIVGDWTPSTPPIVKEEPAFDNKLVAFHEDDVKWSIVLKVPSDAAPGKTSLRAQISYLVCDAMSCSPEGRVTLPEQTLTILPGEASVAATPPSPDRETSSATVAPRDVPTASSPPRVVSDVEEKSREGIVPLMIASALGGLLALAMPCVWPMVPVTVNFFVKQGQKNKGRTTGLAITYCLAIVGVFTAIGVLCSFFVSATALPRLANNPWLNFAVAGLFFAFGLSLLGLFEISLPSFLLNASAQGESKGGLIGVIFMALTLTITSFTCTFPVVGGLLVMASAGQFFYPIIGLATFATVLALPFFLLALSPGLLSKMPKSGDWMNSVKVVGGLVEIGAALKFLNTAELAFVTPENAWIDAEFVLTAWIVLAAVCGFYLLGFFRTDHDHQEVGIGPGRMILGTSFLGMALFLAPALVGRPPQSPIWDRLVVGLLPPDVSELSASPTLIAGNETVKAQRDEVHATDSDPEKAVRQERRFHGVTWGFSYEQAVERARAERKPILIDFTGVNCSNCRLMEKSVFPKPEVAALLNQFVTVQLYTDYVPISSITARQRQELAEKNQMRQLDLGSEPTNPFYVVQSPEAKVLSTKGGFLEAAVFVEFLNGALKKNEAEGKLARAETGR